MSVRERLDSDHTPSSRGIWDTFADSLCAHQNTKIHLGSEQLRALTLSGPDSKNPLPPRSDALARSLYSRAASSVDCKFQNNRFAAPTAGGQKRRILILLLTMTMMALASVNFIIKCKQQWPLVALTESEWRHLCPHSIRTMLIAG